MALYEYRCPNNHITEELNSFSVGMIQCECGEVATRRMSVCNWSFGWKLSDESLEDPDRRGADEYVRNI